MALRRNYQQHTTNSPYELINTHLSRVHHKSDSIDGDRGLSYVGGDDALPHSVRGHVKDPVLFLNGEGTVKGKDDPPLRLCGVDLGLLHERRDLVHSTEKDEQIAALRGRVLGGGKGNHRQFKVQSTYKYLSPMLFEHHSTRHIMGD